jgi:hypothetical protein
MPHLLFGTFIFEVSLHQQAGIQENAITHYSGAASSCFRYKSQKLRAVSGKHHITIFRRFALKKKKCFVFSACAR